LAFTVEVGRVTDVEPLDCFTEIRIRGLYQKVIVIVRKRRSKPERCSG
jgi:hypothetical protein